MTKPNLAPELRRRRTEQREQARRAFEVASEHLTQRIMQKKLHELLASVGDGLYLEVDKLNKKAPAEQTTKLMCDELNEFIKDATKLMASDPYVARVKPFVAAGEYPENRDALLVLRTLLQGLKRLKPSLAPAIEKAQVMRTETGTVFMALEYWHEHNSAPDADQLRGLLGFKPSQNWLEDQEESEYLVFSFEILDEVGDLAKYFAEGGDGSLQDDDEDSEEDEDEDDVDAYE